MLIALNTLSSTLQAFKKFTNEPDVQVQAVLTFLKIATSENPSGEEIAQHIGLGLSAVSRNLRKLCEPPRGQEGYGLITMEFNPIDHRKRIIKLTARGHTLVRYIEEAMLPQIRAHVIRELIRT